VNPLEVLLCILGFFALFLPVCVVEALEETRGGLPGEGVFLRPPSKLPPLYWLNSKVPYSPEIGTALSDSTPNADGSHSVEVQLGPVDWTKPAPPSDPVADIKEAARLRPRAGCP